MKTYGFKIYDCTIPGWKGKVKYELIVVRTDKQKEFEITIIGDSHYPLNGFFGIGDSKEAAYNNLITGILTRFPRASHRAIHEYFPLKPKGWGDEPIKGTVVLSNKQ
jgi:hypothetical protein